MNRIIILALVAIYLVFSGLIYTQGTDFGQPIKSKTAVIGKILFQKYNCISCHQIYGLGGYMGPDLTNVISTKGKGEIYTRALIKNGMGRMPNFNLQDEEVNALVDYLKHIDSSGKYTWDAYTATWYGNILLDGK